MKQQILPVYSHHSIDQNIKVLEASYEAGIRRFEFTNRHDNALENFATLISLCKSKMSDMELGAGTIINKTDAELFMAEGASFLVSPLISQELIDYTNQKNIEWVPGCATGAEIGLAQNAGIKLVKLYPISTLGGPEFIRLIKGPFYKMKFQTSGGIKGEVEEVKALLSAGAEIVGLGNSFFSEGLSKEVLVVKIKNLVSSL
jgi:2-dehydro-3-deoxyphosphogluconate aldolase / (4S)-4-hydroxy-2-oxoglutarate aldolase